MNVIFQLFLIVYASLLLLSGCISEPRCDHKCFGKVYFLMGKVPFSFVDSNRIDYQPYYFFVEQLELFCYDEGQLLGTIKYDYNYCREHPVITQMLDRRVETIFFITNLHDEKMFKWQYVEGEPTAVFSIIDFQEPPVLLAYMTEAVLKKDTAIIALQMLVSRLEIRITNPPVTLTGIDITVRNIAGSVTSDYVLGDTTHINKRLMIANSGVGIYDLGVNSFPTYQDQTASLIIKPLGTSVVESILVEDSRLQLLPGVVTRLNIVYTTETNITISVEVNGKWEVVEGGHIII